MIELPEATVIAEQMRAELTGKQVAVGNRGNATHKFAFSSGSTEEYEAILTDKTVGQAIGHGGIILVPVEPDYLLVLGGGGERILYHPGGARLPKKHHLLLSFTDGSALTVTVQGWGNTLLLPRAEANDHRHVQMDRIPPLSEGFTWDTFHSLFGEVDPEGSQSVKHFLISEPGVWGVGNGCLQDILYYARIHPKRRVASLSKEERRVLYNALVDTLSQMVELGGRYEERDLYDNRGGYVRILDSKTRGKPCPRCGTPLERSQFLGGAIYFCPICQEL